MNSFYNIFFSLFIRVSYFPALILSLISSSNVFCQTTVNFNYTGSAQTWIVPNCVNTITVTAVGAQGGGPNGGLGATVTATVAVTPGQVLQINVGGQGTVPGAGWNGGGAGQSAIGTPSCFPPYTALDNTSFGGGGGSDIRIAPNTLANRLIVGAGGGGMGGGDTDANGGNGDCNTGTNGVSPFGQGGFGATQIAGGAGGPPWIASGNAGQSGVLGVGGAGGSDPCYNVGPGGGGGGGYYGGGGGGSDCFSSCPLGGGGGGGGSCLVPAGGSCTGANNPGNGQITIAYVAAGFTSTTSSANPNCSGGTGSACVTPGGGTPPYTYVWSPSGGNSSCATGLSAGNYTVTVTDASASGCSSTNTVTITQPAVLNAATSFTNELCGQSNGTATVSPSGGTPGYNFLWSNGQIASTATGLAAGNYSVTITDANGCTYNTVVAVGSTGGPTATTSATNVSCKGGSNGTASVTASNGTPAYTYVWSNGQTTATATGLSAGNYSVIVTDASCSPSGVELVNNGDFSAGNAGFSSGYSYCNMPGCMGPEGTYGVGTNPIFYNGGFCVCGDHTSGSGNMMVVNGAGIPGSNVWCQTIPVTPNTTYNFSTWVTSINPSSPAILQFYINGIPLCASFNAPPACCVWLQFFCVWNSGANTSANICIVNQNTTLGGNDFALDDISFQACTSCSTTAVITVTEPPALVITNVSSTNEFCNRSDGTATVAAAGGTGGFTYLWNPSAQITSTATGLAAGNYSVTVTDANGCTHDTMIVVNFTPGPTANAGTDASICFGFSTSLSATGGGSYVWSPAAGLNNPAISNPVSTPASTTSYTITVTDANNCTATDDVLITVNPKPIASFTVTSNCFNNPTVFTDQSSNGNITQWNWDFGDTPPAFSTLQNPSHTYNAAGTYTATLIVTTAEGCKDTASLTVVVFPVPSVNFSSGNVCINSPTCFTDLSTISSGSISAWSWNFADPNSGANNISNLQNPCHTYTAAGTYTVVLTVSSNNNCQSTTILQTTVLTPPVALFTAPDVCLNAPTVFTDGSTGPTSWSWQFGDGGTSGVQNPQHTYLGYGNYIVTLIVSSGATCADTAYDTVLVNPLPVVNFAADKVCIGDTTSFTDLSFIPAGTISSWNWNFGDGNSDTVQFPVHAYASAGNYNVTLTCTSNNNCTSSVTISVLVYPLPIADFLSSPAPTIDLIDPAEFNDLSTGAPVQWFWNFGDSTGDTVQNPFHLYADTGAYVVTLIVVSNNGCRDTVQKTVEVKDFVFYIPNTFTPNGDELNDFFFGTGLGITQYEMSIFNRWGNLIFTCKVNDVPQTLPCMWDGKARGGSSKERVQEDVYVYKIKFTSVFGREYNFVGQVNVVK
ncbi:MAG: PKD domain-containing protein [Bacteroidetes bacterium]|nr:PKD domain-containing protein [Bacteroidota bacterium]